MKNNYIKPNNREFIKINKESQQIETWCLSRDFDAYKRYTKNGYFEAINNALRAGITNDVFVLNDIQALDRLFEKIPTRVIPKTDITVYRGAFLTNELKDILQGKSKTDTFIDKAFVSTSKSKQVAKQFANNEDKILLQITIPKGSKIIDDEKLPSYTSSIMEGEQEVLLPRNAQFKVLSYDEKSKIVNVLYMGQKRPLEMPDVFEYSGRDILSDLNKNSLLIEKTPLYNKELKNKI
ncbi:MAG: hypothetical protein IJY61_05280 [Candidatus Gastranaerophilales bacterium]|nr:hypothetical protein [Candidatus Gastranaerophilales bacterium]